MSIVGSDNLYDSGGMLRNRRDNIKRLLIFRQASTRFLSNGVFGKTGIHTDVRSLSYGESKFAVHAGRSDFTLSGEGREDDGIRFWLWQRWFSVDHYHYSADRGFL